MFSIGLFSGAGQMFLFFFLGCQQIWLSGCSLTQISAVINLLLGEQKHTKPRAFKYGSLRRIQKTSLRWAGSRYFSTRTVHQRVKNLNVHPIKENPAEEFSQRWLIKPGKVKNSPKENDRCVVYFPNMNDKKKQPWGKEQLWWAEIMRII